MALTQFTFPAPLVEPAAQKVYSGGMRSLRLCLFTWLSLALSGSGWAFAPAGCATTGHDHVAATLAAHHADVLQQGGSHTGQAHSGHGHHGQHVGAESAAESQDSAPTCECCDTCMTGCAFSLSAMTSGGGIQAAVFGIGSISAGQTAQRAPPPIYPLLRPPIPTR